MLYSYIISYAVTACYNYCRGTASLSARVGIAAGSPKTACHAGASRSRAPSAHSAGGASSSASRRP